MGIWSYLLSLGRPKEVPDQQWQEILLTRRKVEELERRLRSCEEYRPVLRYRVMLAPRELEAAGPEKGVP
jgi:hypothetical protein